MTSSNPYTHQFSEKEIRVSKKLPSLTIFFPAYCDQGTVEPLTKSCISVAAQIAEDYEIIIVDDASPDDTGQIADRMAAEHACVKVIHHPKNRGVGGAMISGFQNATKEYIFYTDGDAQYDMKELARLVGHAFDHDLVTGYRIKRAEGFKRIFTSKSFHLLVLLFFRVLYRDIDCSFKLMNRPFLDSLQFKTQGGLIDTEIYVHAKKGRFRVKQVGVNHYNRPYGESQCLKAGLIFSMLRDLFLLRFRLWKK